MAVSSASLKDAILSLSSSESSSSFLQSLHLILTRSLKYPRRNELPATFTEWKNICSNKTRRYSNLWTSLEGFLNEHQYTLFRRKDEYNQTAPSLPAPSNYNYISINHIDYYGGLVGFCVPTGCHHAARKQDRHYVIRVVRVGEQGANHLQILRLLSNTVPDNLYSNYHILPMVEEMMYEDIYFAVFPLARGQLQAVLAPYMSESALEDALSLIMQALEEIIYIHGKNIAHRDLFTDNFLVDFLPESLRGSGQQWSRPRVYLSDFETAIHIPDDAKPSERLVSGFPFEDFGLEEYNRKPPAPELLLPEPHMYCPFQLDMYQFGCHLNKYLKTTGCEELDALWPPLMSDNPAERPTAHELFKRLGDFINKTPPKDLQRAWTYEDLDIES